MAKANSKPSRPRYNNFTKANPGIPTIPPPLPGQKNPKYDHTKSRFRGKKIDERTLNDPDLENGTTQSASIFMSSTDKTATKEETKRAEKKTKTKIASKSNSDNETDDDDENVSVQDLKQRIAELEKEMTVFKKLAIDGFRHELTIIGETIIGIRDKLRTKIEQPILDELHIAVHNIYIQISGASNFPNRTPGYYKINPFGVNRDGSHANCDGMAYRGKEDPELKSGR